MHKVKKLYSVIAGSIKANKVLTLILFLAVLLRFIGIYPGYHPYHSDEGMSYSSAIEMIRNLNIDPTRYDYPSLVPIINTVLYVVFFIPTFILKNLLFSQEDLPTKAHNIIELWQQVVIQNQQTVVLFWGRYVTAAFGVGVVLLVYLVAKTFFNDKRIGLVAAFLTAVNFRQVLNSHLGLPDIYNAFFLLLSFLSLGLLLKNPSRKNYIFAGVAAALYICVKYQIFIAPAFLLVHLYVVWKKTKLKTPALLIRNFFSRDFILSLAVIPLIGLLLNPYHFIHWDQFQAINSYNVFKYSVGVKMLNFYPLSYLYHIGIGKIISIAIIFGLIVGFRKYAFKSFILFTYILIFFFLAIYYTRGGYYTRNFVTVTPLLLIFAAVFLINFWDILGRVLKLHKNLIVLFLSASVIFISWEQIKNSSIASYHFTKPWGFKSAHDWAQVNIPAGAKVVSHPWDNYPRDKNLEIIPFEQNEIFSIAEMREDGASFGFLNMDWVSLGSYWWMNRNTQTSLEFWEKPNKIMENSYQGVVSRELANYTIAGFVKPWQAPDMNFLLVKIPPMAKIKDKILISDFSFKSENDLSQWTLIDGDFGRANKIVFNSEIGKNSPGSLEFKDGTRRFPVLRVTSPVLPIESNKAIIVEGWIKSGNVIDKKARDGFLRVDFYNENPGEITLTTKSLQSDISSRFFGGTNWTKQEVIVFPPTDAKFMSVGVQVNNFTQFWFDDIKVYKSVQDVENPTSGAPYIDYRIPDEILFPYSQGGL